MKRSLLGGRLGLVLALLLTTGVASCVSSEAEIQEAEGARQFGFVAPLPETPEWILQLSNTDYEIATINLHGSEGNILTSNRQMDHFPVWSPDGSRIALLRASVAEPRLGKDVFRLHIINADGTGNTRLELDTEGGLALLPPVWSPDGQWLALVGPWGTSPT